MSVHQIFFDRVDAARGVFADDRATIKSIVERLAWRNQQARALPLRLQSASLTIHGGSSISGVVVGVSEREGLVTVAVSGGNEHHLAFVNLGAVVSVIVHDVDLAEQPPRGVEVQGRLDLARRARALGEPLGVVVEVEGDHEQDGPRLVLQLLVERVEAALPRIAVDDEGKKALREKAPKWRLSTKSRGVTLEGGVLTVGATSVTVVPSAERLQQDVEKLL